MEEGGHLVELAFCCGHSNAQEEYVMGDRGERENNLVKAGNKPLPVVTVVTFGLLWFVAFFRDKIYFFVE